MGRAKDEWFENEHQNPVNWKTKKCTNCGDSYKVNSVTKRDKSPELNLCDICYDKLILGKK